MQREPSGAIHDNLASVTQLPDDTRDYDPEDLITVSHAQEDEKGTITGPSPDLIEIDFREEAVQAADSPRQPSPPNEPVTLPSQNPNEVMQDALRDQEDNGMYSLNMLFDRFLIFNKVPSYPSFPHRKPALLKPNKTLL